MLMREQRVRLARNLSLKLSQDREVLKGALHLAGMSLRASVLTNSRQEDLLHQIDRTFQILASIVSVAPSQVNQMTEERMVRY